MVWNENCEGIYGLHKGGSDMMKVEAVGALWVLFPAPEGDWDWELLSVNNLEASEVLANSFFSSPTWTTIYFDFLVLWLRQVINPFWDF